MYMSVYLSRSIYQSIHLSIYLSIYICLSIYLPTYLHIFGFHIRIIRFPCQNKFEYYHYITYFYISYLHTCLDLRNLTIIVADFKVFYAEMSVCVHNALTIFPPHKCTEAGSVWIFQRGAVGTPPSSSRLAWLYALLIVIIVLICIFQASAMCPTVYRHLWSSQWLCEAGTIFPKKDPQVVQSCKAGSRACRMQSHFSESPDPVFSPRGQVAPHKGLETGFHFISCDFVSLVLNFHKRQLALHSEEE
jgi:hypothetical protein